MKALITESHDKTSFLLYTAQLRMIWADSPEGRAHEGRSKVTEEKIEENRDIARRKLSTVEHVGNASIYNVNT